MHFIQLRRREGREKEKEKEGPEKALRPGWL